MSKHITFLFLILACDALFAGIVTMKNELCRMLPIKHKNNGLVFKLTPEALKDR